MLVSVKRVIDCQVNISPHYQPSTQLYIPQAEHISKIVIMVQNQREHFLKVDNDVAAVNLQLSGAYV
jgi:hypothetical protein